MLSMFAAAGYIVRQPSLNHTSTGTPVAHVVVSIVTDPTKGPSGYAHTEFAEISYFGQSASTVMNYLRKGMQISFAGSLTRIDTYLREDGTPGATIKLTGTQLQLPPKPQQAEAAPAPAQERVTEAPAAPAAPVGKAPKARKAQEQQPEECDFGIG